MPAIALWLTVGSRLIENVLLFDRRIWLCVRFPVSCVSQCVQMKMCQYLKSRYLMNKTAFSEKENSQFVRCCVKSFENLLAIVNKKRNKEKEKKTVKACTLKAWEKPPPPLSVTHLSLLLLFFLHVCTIKYFFYYMYWIPSLYFDCFIHNGLFLYKGKCVCVLL